MFKTRTKCPLCGNALTRLPRSTQQNRAYFGIAVKLIGDHLGYDREEMHKALAGKFLGFDEVKIGDEVMLVPKSTTHLSTREFNEYYAKIQRWAAEFLNISIPDPNEEEK